MNGKHRHLIRRGARDNGQCEGRRQRVAGAGDVKDLPRRRGDVDRALPAPAEQDARVAESDQEQHRLQMSQ